MGVGKREAKRFEVDPVALHIHERVSAQAIVNVGAARERLSQANLLECVVLEHCTIEDSSRSTRRRRMPGPRDP